MTIGNIAKGRVTYCQMNDIWCILSGVLTVLYQGHLEAVLIISLERGVLSGINVSRVINLVVHVVREGTKTS